MNTFSKKNTVSTIVMLTSLSVNIHQTIASTTPDFPFYTSVNDVQEHSYMDLDVVAMDEALDEMPKNFTIAKQIYLFGANSNKDDELRTLSGFSTGLDKKANTLNDVSTDISETLLPEYFTAKSYWNNNPTYAHDFVTHALDGTGYAQGLAEISRQELAVKGVQYQVVWMYILRELYEALKACRDETGPAEKAWDEGVAFYVGSLVSKDGANGRDGALMYTLADKRCGAWGTCYTPTDSQDDKAPISTVNVDAMSAFRQGLVAVQENNCVEISQQILLIRKQMQISVLQGLLQYAHLSDTKVGPILPETSSTFLSQMKKAAEGWAFAASMLPFIHEQDSDAAAIIRKNMEMNEETTAPDTLLVDGYEQVFEQVYKVLPKLCISCEEIGANTFVVKEGSNAEVPECVTDQTALEAGCDEYLRPTQDASNVGLIVGLLVACAVILIVLGMALFWLWNTTDKNGSETEGINEV